MTKKQLRKLIQEEYKKVLKEDFYRIDIQIK